MYIICEIRAWLCFRNKPVIIRIIDYKLNYLYMDRLRFPVFFFFIFLMSCSRERKLSENDYKWMPYVGNETLIFRSNTGILDTIFLLKKDTFLLNAQPLSLIPIQYQSVSIFCKHSDSVIQDSSVRYLESYFCSIRTTKNNHAILEVRLNTKDAFFPQLGPIKLDSLSRVVPITLKTKYNQYHDVYVIKSEDFLGFLNKRHGFVTKIYWSKTKGLVRFDKRDSVYWELAE